MIRFVPFETEEFAGMIALDSEEKEIGRRRRRRIP